MKYLLIVALLAAVVLAQGEGKNEEVTRTFVFRSTSVVEAMNHIKFAPGKGTKSYYYIVPKEFENNLVQITAGVMPKTTGLNIERVAVLPKNLQAVSGGANSSDWIYFRIDLEGAQEGGVVELGVRELHKRRREPFPSKINAKEDQYVKFEDSKYFLSLYPTKTQKLSLALETKNTVAYYTKDDTTDKKQRSIRYGPYLNVKPLTYEFLRIHYLNNGPMAIFTEMQRTIEISHWGNINVEDHIEMINEGAGVKGEWGRIDFNLYDPSNGRAAIKIVEIDLPRYIRGLYFYDYIGNISTSVAHRNEEVVNLKLEPRFPIFGGWNSDWNVGYNMPTKYHLFTDANNPSNYVFNFTFLHDFQDILTENYTVKVILPEGATNIKAHLPFEVDEDSRDLHFSTLDYIGRPVVVIKKSNVFSPEHSQIFQISYTFETASLFIEPIYVIAVVFACFLTAIGFARFSSGEDDKAKPKHKVN